jgi:hypothetical protein
MKNKLKQLGIISIVALAFCVIDSCLTSLYWQHLAVVHSAAIYEANSWGVPSFHWNDVSFAQAPFQDPQIYQQKSDEAFVAKLKKLGIN